MQNSNNKVENTFSLKYILISAAFITLYINPALQDPFNSPKFWILIIAGSWLIGKIIFQNLKFKGERSLIFTLVLAGLFLLFYLIAAVATDVSYNAFIGETQRKLGFTTYLFFITYLIGAMIIVKNSDTKFG